MLEKCYKNDFFVKNNALIRSSRRGDKEIKKVTEVQKTKILLDSHFSRFACVRKLFLSFLICIFIPRKDQKETKDDFLRKKYIKFPSFVNESLFYYSQLLLRTEQLPWWFG